MWDKKYSEELLAKRQKTIDGGGQKRIEKQHQTGKLTARERVEMLFDPNTFVELGMLVESRCDEFGMAQKKVPGDGVIIGYGMIDGRIVYASI